MGSVGVNKDEVCLQYVVALAHHNPEASYRPERDKWVLHGRWSSPVTAQLLQLMQVKWCSGTRPAMVNCSLGSSKACPEH